MYNKCFKLRKNFIFIGIISLVLSVNINAGTAASDSNYFLVNGQPFFPMGFYYEHGGSYTNHLNTLNRLADAGFNLMFITYQMSEAELNSFLTEAAKRNVMIIIEGASSTIQSHFKDNQALLAWSIASDINNYAPSEIVTRNQAAKAADPNHCTYSSAWRIEAKNGDFAAALDGIGCQTYPIPVLRSWQDDGGLDIAFPFRMINHMKTQVRMRNLKTVIMQESQAFSWWQNAGDRIPTARELDNMNYQALIAGAKGFMPYTYSNCCTNDSEVWNQMKKNKREIYDSLRNVIMFGKRVLTPVTGYESSVFSAYWVYQGKVYVIVVNCNASTVNVSVAIPQGAQAPVNKMFADRPGSFTMANGKLGGSMSGLDVHVYVLTAGPDNQKPEITSLNPLNKATAVIVSSNLVISFNEPVQAKTGFITIYNKSDKTEFEKIAASNTALIKGVGSSTITIIHSKPFLGETGYYIKIDNLSFADAANNYFAGINDSTTWTFTTAKGNGILSPAVNPINNNRLKIARQHNLLSVYVPYDGKNRIQINDIQGRKLYSAVTEGQEYMIPVKELAHGINIVTADLNKSNKISQTILIP